MDEIIHRHAFEAKLQSNGLVTVPKRFRDHYDITAGDTIVFMPVNQETTAHKYTNYRIKELDDRSRFTVDEYDRHDFGYDVTEEGMFVVLKYSDWMDKMHEKAIDKKLQEKYKDQSMDDYHGGVGGDDWA